jgi:hypothetical protein
VTLTSKRNSNVQVVRCGDTKGAGIALGMRF